MAQDPRLVEMVARAICNADGRAPDDTIVELGNVPQWQRYVYHAEAAIAVINRSVNP